MKRPQSTFVESFIVKWLVEGYTETFWNGAGIWAFPGAESYIAGLGREIVENKLSAFYYKGLGKSEKKLFRRAVAFAFAEFGVDKKNLPIIRSILRLAGRIDAVEILPALLNRVLYYEFLDSAVKVGETNICGDIIYAIAPLAPCGGKTFRLCLNAIRKSPHYSRKSDHLLEVV